MAKQSIVHYYVQAKKKDEAPEIVYHTHDKETNEYFYKFLNKKQAKKLAEDEKKISPDVKFRVVKLTEVYDVDSWF